MAHNIPKLNLENTTNLKAVSLFTGAGGMDIGFINAGISVCWANDFDSHACSTYQANHNAPIVCGEIDNHISTLEKFKGVDFVFGGPPCQGFSVAGKMDTNDPRSKLLWSFLRVVDLIKPRAFVCENVKALAKLQKWKPVREAFLAKAHSLGYGCKYVVLSASDYGVPQSRERVFFIGIKENDVPDLDKLMKSYRQPSKTVREAISDLGKPHTSGNTRVCNAKVTLAASPVLRKSAYAGMLFNGLGRPLKIDGFSATLPASMGGNKTPIIDDDELYEGKPSWVEDYHKKLLSGCKPTFDLAPARLRRLTIDEAIRLMTFPVDYKFSGPNSAIWRQIGNAVPPKLAESVARAVVDLIEKKIDISLLHEDDYQSQLSLTNF